MKLAPVNKGVEEIETVSRRSQLFPFRPGGHLQTYSPWPVASQYEPCAQGFDMQGSNGVSQNSPVYSRGHSQVKLSVSKGSQIPPFRQGMLEQGLDPHSRTPSILIIKLSLISWKFTERLLIFKRFMQPAKPLLVPMFS